MKSKSKMPKSVTKLPIPYLKYPGLNNSFCQQTNGV